MSGITVTRHQGRLLATKPAGADTAQRRRQEAEILGRVDHPGVVSLVEVLEGPPMELRLGFVGPDTWASRPPADAELIVDGLASVSATIADLHELGIAHRALGPEHVVVAADGRPVLCGLADAGPSDDPACFADLHGLAGLIDHLAAGAGSELAGRLGDLARRAERGGLTARDLATELAGLRPGPNRPRISRLGRSPVTPAAAVIVAVTAAAVAWIALSQGGSRSAPSSPAVPASSTPAIADPVVTEPPRPSPTTPQPSAATEVVDQPLVITHDGRRYGVSGADIALLGDWNCDGAVAPAALDTRSGRVVLFTGWPAAGATSEPAHTATVPGATDLRVDAEAPCGRLRVVHADGSTLLAPELP